VTVWASLVATPILDHYLPMGHALWLTGWNFILGVCVQRTGFSVRPLLEVAGALAFAVMLFVLNAIFVFKVLNFYLILAISVCVVLWLKDANLPARALRPLSLVSSIVLEVYFIHSYLYVRVSGIAVVDYAVSLGCVLATAWLLNRIASPIRGYLKGHILGAGA
jgi:surface polysaccharide O-acyltransferase-like enzyme